MEMINEFLRSQGEAASANYGLMGTFGQVFAGMAGVFYLIRMKAKWLDWIKGMVMMLIGFYFCVFAYNFLTWYRSGFALDAYEQVSNLAVSFTLLPLVAWLCAKAFNTSVGFAGDAITLFMLGFHTLGRSGCVFGGCCYGFPCDWGIYSRYTQANQFPVCIVESLFTLGIFIFVLVRICRKGYVPDGRNLPWFLLLYGTCRFFSEFTRESTSQFWLFWRFSDVHIHMLVMAALGGYLLYRNTRRAKAAAVSAEEPQLPELSGIRH